MVLVVPIIFVRSHESDGGHQSVKRIKYRMVRQLDSSIQGRRRQVRMDGCYLLPIGSLAWHTAITDTHDDQHEDTLVASILLVCFLIIL